MAALKTVLWEEIRVCIYINTIQRRSSNIKKRSVRLNNPYEIATNYEIEEHRFEMIINFFSTDVRTRTVPYIYIYIIQDLNIKLKRPTSSSIRLEDRESNRITRVSVSHNAAVTESFLLGISPAPNKAPSLDIQCPRRRESHGAEMVESDLPRASLQATANQDAHLIGAHSSIEVEHPITRARCLDAVACHVEVVVLVHLILAIGEVSASKGIVGCRVCVWLAEQVCEEVVEGEPG